MSDVTDKMYDVMSVTKAVIGIMYYIHKPNTNEGLLNMKDTTRLGIMTTFETKWRQKRT